MKWESYERCEWVWEITDLSDYDVTIVYQGRSDEYDLTVISWNNKNNYRTTCRSLEEAQRRAQFFVETGEKTD